MVNPINRSTLTGLVGFKGELRRFGDNNAAINFTVGTTRRIFDKETNEWSNGPTIWSRCVAFGRTAENIEKSIEVGDPVIIFATMSHVKEYVDSQGVERPASIEFIVDEIGLSVTNFPVEFNRTRKGSENSSPRSSSRSIPDNTQVKEAKTPVVETTPTPDPDLSSDDFFDDDFFEQ